MEKIAIVLCLLISPACQYLSDQVDKFNGLSLSGGRSLYSQEMFDVMVAQTSANAIAIIPYAFSPGDTSLYFNIDRQWISEREEGLVHTISLARQKGFSIMIKPHIWVRGQGWAGEFELNNDQEWKVWEKKYKQYVLSMARLAETYDAEVFCIGTEMRLAVRQRPEFFIDLIKAVRKQYGGKITYAANWDNYEHVVFWNHLDFVGIDAYFPVLEAKTPTIAEAAEAFGSLSNALKAFSENQGKPILFTEFGFESVDHNLNGHWRQNNKVFNAQAQENAFHAFFSVFWNEPYIAGGFLWKYFPDYMSNEPLEDTFSPQGKPAINVIRKYYQEID